MELKHNPEDAIVNGIQYYPVYRGVAWKSENHTYYSISIINEQIYEINKDIIQKDLDFKHKPEGQEDLHYWEWIAEPQDLIVQTELERWRNKGYEAIFKGTEYKPEKKVEYVCCNIETVEHINNEFAYPSGSCHFYYWLLEKTKHEKQKPPLGLMPKSIHEHLRRLDILKAMLRYESKGKKVPKEWIEEYVKLSGHSLETVPF